MALKKAFLKRILSSSHHSSGTTSTTINYLFTYRGCGEERPQVLEPFLFFSFYMKNNCIFIVKPSNNTRKF